MSIANTKPPVSRLFAAIDMQDDNPADAKPLSEFKVKTAVPPRPPQEMLDEVAEKNGFDSRQPARPARLDTQPANSQEPAADIVPRTRKRRRQSVPRTQQINFRVTESTMERYYALVDKLQVPMGEVLDRLLETYEKQSSKK